jgi:hypothetical protein
VALARGQAIEAAASFARAAEELEATVDAGHPDLVAARRGAATSQRR